jgi:BirA family transcriptional regulator, biotin operon repressor / biotin---[acetyl-CoA-carboxylase] ligase
MLWPDTACDRRLPLLRQLADGNFHSGEQLGRELGISRAAVHKQMQGLAELGLAYHAINGRGYRLEQALPLLQPERWPSPPVDLAWVLSIDSTNAALMRERRQLATGFVLLAEHQSAGRGRRGRQWVSPLGSNLYLSLLWRFEQGLEAVLGLSQAVALACHDALAAAGAEGVALKWPNDLLWQGRKLGGILIELSGQPGEPTDVVIGVGINVQMRAEGADGIDQPWCTLEQIMNQQPDRNLLAPALIHSLRAELARFAEHGLKGRLADWQRLDAFADQQVELLLGNEQRIKGQVQGIDEQGALLLRTDNDIQRFLGGEVSLRRPA